MATMTTQEAANFDNSLPAAQNSQIGKKLKAALDGEFEASLAPDASKVVTDNIGTPFVIAFAITADGSSGLNIYNADAPFNFEILDIIVQSRATSASGTVTVSDGTNNISNAVAMDTDNAVTRVGTLDDAYSTLAAGDSLVVTTNGAADRGLVTLVCVKR